MEELTFNHTSFDGWEEEEEYQGPCTFSTSNTVNGLLTVCVDPVIGILGFVGNILVILTVVSRNKKGEERKTFEVFHFNLAITNLFFIVALPFLIYNELFSWPMGQGACKLLHASYSINFYSGMLLIAVMSIVQFLAVRDPQSQEKAAHNKAIICCAFIWVFAILFSFPNFYFYNWYDPTGDYIVMPESEDENETSASPHYVCEFQFEDSDSSNLVKVAVPSIQMAVGFFLPLVIIICSYTSIIIILTKKKKTLIDSDGKQCSKTSSRNIDKATINVTGIILVFVVCHLPYNIVLLYDTINMFQEVSCEAADGRQTALFVAQTISYLQCCLNPVMYGFLMKNFRKKFNDVFRLCLRGVRESSCQQENILSSSPESLPLKTYST